MFSESWLNTYADSDFSEGYFDLQSESVKSIETFYSEQHMDKGRESHVINGGHVQAGMFADSQQNAVVIGFEDFADLWIGCDHDYNDDIFAIIMEPKQIGDIPKLDDTDDTNGSEYAVGALLYEDLFPSEGDYDMNDVVIRYTWIKHFDKNNCLTKIEYRFVPISVRDNSLYVSEFYLMIDDAATGRIIKPAGTPIFTNHKEAYNKNFTGAYELTDKNLKKDDVTWDMFNPFIFVTATGHEVHLAKKRFGGIGSSTAYDSLDLRQQSYLTPAKKAQYSFALNIPTSYFEIVTEGVRIDAEYPLYLTWFVTEGREGADWYLPANHRPTSPR